MNFRWCADDLHEIFPTVEPENIAQLIRSARGLNIAIGSITHLYGSGSYDTAVIEIQTHYLSETRRIRVQQCPGVAKTFQNFVDGVDSFDSEQLICRTGRQ